MMAQAMRAVLFAKATATTSLGFSTEQGRQPGVGLGLFRAEQHRVGAVNEEAAEITVPSLANSTETRFAAGGVLSRHQPKPSGELSATAEYARVCDSCCNCGGDDRPYPRDGGQT